MRLPWSRKRGPVGSDAVIAVLKERLAELEAQVTKGGWASGFADAATISRPMALTAARTGRLLSVLNPLVRNGVRTQCDYLFGMPITVTTNDSVIRPFVDRWWSDPGNRIAVTAPAKLWELEWELQCSGNVFLACWTDPATGRVLVRPWLLEEVVDILTDPDDRAETWYYVRQVEGGHRVHAAVGHIPNADELRQFKLPSGTVLDAEAAVFHVRAGAIGASVWGLSELVAAEPWAREVTADLTDYASVRKALASLVWRVAVRRKSAESATTTIGAIAAKFRGTPEPTPSDAMNSGALWVSGPGVMPEAINKSGAQPQTESGRRLWLMVGAALGLPETMLSGDVSVGTLATAKSLDRPTELKMLRRRGVWQEVIERLGQYALLQQAKAGMLPAGYRVEQDAYARRETVVDKNGKPVTIEIRWAPILERENAGQIQGIIQAATLGGAMKPGELIPLDLVQQLLLAALGVEDSTDVPKPEMAAPPRSVDEAAQALELSARALANALRQ